ncbi:MAG: response regulator [Tannerellaceae bacterium]|jgi:signal transduction histidine kinase/ligand-binding sensor domain-containing protein/DNA-binding response OmpR family regulator|nr:response regulator [Tannerellaceae bacterium]
MFKKALCFIVVFVGIWPAWMQADPGFRFRTFSPEGGFDYSGISSIRQDKEGAMWFITDKALYRFDGYEHKNYNLSFNEFNPALGKARRFNSIGTDQLGNVFVGTNNGLFAYDRLKDDFAIVSDKVASYLYADRYNKLWMMLNGALTVRDSSLMYEPLFEGNRLLDIISYAGDEVSLFVASKREIYRYDYEAKAFSLFFSFDAETEIQSISRYRNKLWALAANRGLLKIDIPTAAIEREYNFFHRENDGNVLTKMICTDRHGSVWIATQKGLYILDPESGRYTHHRHSDANPFGLPNNSVWDIYEDRQQNIWLGTYSGGVCYINLSENEWLKNFSPLESPLNNKLVSGFAESEDFLWITTEGGGVNRMDLQTGEFSYLTHIPNRNSLAYNNTKSLAFDSKQRLWIAMFRGGMDCYDTRTGKFRHFKHDPNDENSLITNDLRKIWLEGDSGLWIIYQSNRVVVSFYSFDNNRFTHYRLNDGYEFIHDMCRGANKVWLVAEKLYMIDVATREIGQFTLDSGTLNGQSICMDGNEDLWIGTIGSGLVKFNTKTSAFTVYDEILRRNAYSIFSICTDDENNIWMGTNNGLFKYEINSGAYMHFDKHDGIQGPVFYPNAAFRSKTGKLYFGGTNGFTQLNPALLSRNRQKPNVIFSEFYINNAPAIPPASEASRQEAASFPTHIILNHKQAGFGFKFSSDNYLTPEKNRFRYRLKGYDNNWTEARATERNAFFSKVPAGDYVFEISVANNDGLWNDAPASIRIKRLPEPWRSFPAYCIYIIMIALVVGLILRYYNKQKSLKMQLYLDAIDKEKKEDIHQSQLRFFTNVSHDFRTPLILIIAVLEKLRNGGEWKPDYGRILDNNANRLLGLVNELMDFRTIENDKMPLRVCQTDVNLFVKTIADDFKNFALQKGIKFRIRCDDKLPTLLYVDRNILEKIILNLLNNAFKYTEGGGEIIIETHAAPERFAARHGNSFTVKGDCPADQNFVIAVRDTGIGISKESINEVFERFYKVNTADFDSHLGTGIGLALVKSLVLLHKGILTIYSERGTGTDIVVQLPCDPTFYTEDHLEVGGFNGAPKCNKRPSTLPSHCMDSSMEITIASPDAKHTNALTTAVELSEEIFPSRKRILLVEDNDDLRHLIADALSDTFDVSEAANGAIACNMLKVAEPDLIISDIIMPEMDGIRLCRAVKSEPDLSHIPLILLTAKTGMESRLEGVDSGADMYFEKPVDSRLLCAYIHNIFSLRKKLQEYHAKNYFADTSKLAYNRHDKEFLKRFVDILEQNIDSSEIDIAYIASELGVSRSKLYTKIKGITGKSTVEFVLSYRLKKAAALLIENELSIKEIIEQVGIESQSYFSSSFKKEFGKPPSAFARKHSGKKEKV